MDDIQERLRLGEEERRWVEHYRLGYCIPDYAVARHPILMQRMKDFGTPERLPDSAHWRMKEMAHARS